MKVGAPFFAPFAKGGYDGRRINRSTSAGCPVLSRRLRKVG